VHALGYGLFTTAHALAWFLIITLFGAAFATYRRAVNIHGALVPNPAMISAWRLSDIANWSYKDIGAMPVCSR